jgi:Interleukin-like EMT inducer
MNAFKHAHDATASLVRVRWMRRSPGATAIMAAVAVIAGLVAAGPASGSSLAPSTVGAPLAAAGGSAAAQRPTSHSAGVSAGVDHRIPVGTSDELVGKLNGHTPTDARWKLVSAPHGGPRAINGRKARPVKLVSAAGTTARFTPTTPGEYTFAFTSGSGSSASRDLVKLIAVPARVLVPIDTNVKGGIRIGDTTYPAEGTGSTIQVVVLDRKTLRVESNKTYAATQKQALETDLKGLTSASLVVVAGRESDQYHGLPLELLESIGATAPTRTVWPAVFSAIGVHGWKPGQADQVVDRSDPSFGLRGYLTPDQHREYGFVPSERSQLSFAPKPLDPCQASCDRDGYLIHAYDPYTMRPDPWPDDKFYDTDGQNLTAAQQTAEAARMARALELVPADDVVTIQSVGTRLPGHDVIPAPVGAIDGTTMDQLATAVASVGGTRNAFNQTAVRAPNPKTGGLAYALVGWGDAGQGNGVEIASQLVDSTGDGSTQGLDHRTEGPVAPTLSVALRPNNQSQLRPAGESGMSQALNDEIMRPPSDDWRCGDRPCREARGVADAISYIGTNDVTQLGHSPRAQYGIADWTPAELLGIHSALEALRGTEAPGRHDLFDQADWDAAIDQLLKENSEISIVRGYLERLAAPFTDRNLANYIKVQTIADEIFNASKAPAGGDVTFRWLDLTKILLKLIGPATEGTTAAVGGFIDLGQWLAGALQDGAPTYDTFNIKAHAFGAAVQEQADRIKPELESLGNIIVSDPVKLAYFANADCAEGPKCPKALQLDREQADRTANAYRRSVESLAYQTFLPLGYNVYELTRHGNNAHGPQHEGPWLAPPKIHDYVCGIFYASPSPWKDVSPLASVATLQSIDPSVSPQKPRSYYETYVIAEPPTQSGQEHATGADEKLMKTMFDPEDEGGLGISPTQFVIHSPRSWWWGNAASEAHLCWWGD